MAQNSNVPRLPGDYITQVSEQIEGRVTKKLSQEFSRTEGRILGALSRLDDFLQNPLIQGHFETAPETSRITLGTNQGTNDDDSQCDLHPEKTISQSQNTRNIDPDNESDTTIILEMQITQSSATSLSIQHFPDLKIKLTNAKNTGEIWKKLKTLETFCFGRTTEHCCNFTIICFSTCWDFGSLSDVVAEQRWLFLQVLCWFNYWQNNLFFRRFNPVGENATRTSSLLKFF